MCWSNLAIFLHVIIMILNNSKQEEKFAYLQPLTRKPWQFELPICVATILYNNKIAILV